MQIPANVILTEAFAEIFDGFSIGSNDLPSSLWGWTATPRSSLTCLMSATRPSCS